MAADKLRVLLMSHSARYAEKDGKPELRLPGWVEGLMNACITNGQDEIALAFLCRNASSWKWQGDSTTFYPLNQKLKNPFRRWWYKWSHAIGLQDARHQYDRILKDFQPDIIVAFGTEFGHAEIAKQTKTPVIVHIQSIASEYLRHWFAGGYSVFNLLSPASFRHLVLGSGAYHAYRRFRKQAKRESRIFSQCQFFLGRTEWDRRIHRFLSPGSQYFHCDEILRAEFYGKSWTKPQNGTLTISTIMNPNLYKGLETAYLAAKLLSNAAPGTVRWNIIGIEENDEIARIARQKLPIARMDSNIVFHGNLPAVDVADMLLASDMYVHTSYIENSANSICEAMLLGMPVIASSSGGTPSLITHGYNGLLYPPSDAYALAGHISILHSDRSLAESLSANARATAQERHNPVTIAAHFHQICLQVLKK